MNEMKTLNQFIQGLVLQGLPSNSEIEFGIWYGLGGIQW